MRALPLAEAMRCRLLTQSRLLCIRRDVRRAFRDIVVFTCRAGGAGGGGVVNGWFIRILIAQ